MLQPTTNVTGDLVVGDLDAQTIFYGGNVTVTVNLHINNACGGVVIFSDGLTLTESTVTHFNLWGYDRGAHMGYDCIDVKGGSLVLDGTIKIEQTGSFPTMNLKAGDSFDLFNWDEGVTVINNGVEFDFRNAPLADGLYWDTSKFYEDGTIFVTDVEPSIPEPSVAGLAAVTALGMLLRRRRQR